MATSARDLNLFCKVMLQYEAWIVEHQNLFIEWRTDVAEQGKGLPNKLVFGILADDGVVAPHPPIQKAIEKTRAALLAAGHEVIDYTPVDHQASWDLIVGKIFSKVQDICNRHTHSQVKLYFLDGGAEYFATMAESGEPPIPSFSWIVGHTKERPAYTIAEMFALNTEREKLRAKAHAHWNATAKMTKSGRPVDVILTPVAPTLAPPHDSVRWWGYSSHWNLLDYPAAVFPVGQLCASEWKEPAATTPIPSPRNDVEKYIRAQWDPKTYDNAPIALQVSLFSSD